jgi:hypothetical protein
VEVVVVEQLRAVVAQRPVVAAAVVGVGMTVVVSEEMRSVYADLSREAVESQVWVGIAQGQVVVSGRIAGMYLRGNTRRLLYLYRCGCRCCTGSR